MLATLALKQGCKPATIHEDSVLLRAYQATLIDEAQEKGCTGVRSGFNQFFWRVRVYLR